MNIDNFVKSKSYIDDMKIDPACFQGGIKNNKCSEHACPKDDEEDGSLDLTIFQEIKMIQE